MVVCRLGGCWAASVLCVIQEAKSLYLHGKSIGISTGATVELVSLAIKLEIARNCVQSSFCSAQFETILPLLKQYIIISIIYSYFHRFARFCPFNFHL